MSARSCCGRGARGATSTQSTSAPSTGPGSSAGGRCPAPCVVAGDFNQRIPRVKGANRAAAEALAAAFTGLTVVTAGRIDGCDRPGIDHIACTEPLVAERVWGWRNDETRHRLSDHDGAAADLTVPRVVGVAERHGPACICRPVRPSVL